MPTLFLAKGQPLSREANGKKLPVTSMRTLPGQKYLKMNTEGVSSLNFSLALHLLFPFITAQHGVQGRHPCWPLHSCPQRGCSVTAQMMQPELLLPLATALPKLHL